MSPAATDTHAAEPDAKLNAILDRISAALGQHLVVVAWLDLG
jgi:hypothetical protein